MINSPESERRRVSAQAFYGLLSCIRSLQGNAIRQGLTPSEVWLGPVEARILEVEMNWQDREGRLCHTNANIAALIRGQVEGIELFGLTVRLMVKDGVRVGTSFPLPATASSNEPETPTPPEAVPPVESTPKPD